MTEHEWYERTQKSETALRKISFANCLTFSLGPVSTKLLRRHRHTRRCLNHFYVEPIESFHRDFASVSKSASDATDASAQNYNLDAPVNTDADAKAWWEQALIRPGFHQRHRRRRTRRRLNHFYVEPPECFHRDFASASKSASDVTDASAQNYNLDARVNVTPLVETGSKGRFPPSFASASASAFESLLR